MILSHLYLCVSVWGDYFIIIYWVSSIGNIMHFYHLFWYKGMSPCDSLITSLLFGRMVAPLSISPVGRDILLQLSFWWREEVPLELNSA